VTCARISSYRAAVCACIRRLRGVVPRGARSSSCPGYLWLSAFEHPLVLLNQFRTGRRGASCARPAVVVPPPLEVGPRVGPLPLVPVALCRSRRPLSLWRLRRRSSAKVALLAYGKRTRPRWAAAATATAETCSRDLNNLSTRMTSARRSLGSLRRLRDLS
jgi:hypothetical protein